MLAKLIVLNGKQAGQSVPLVVHHENLLGREQDCNLVMEDPACSRHHVSLFQEDGQWHLRDCDSANGTYLNGDRIDSSPLKDGDKILVGSTWIRFLAIEAAPQSADRPPPTWVLEDSVRPETSLSSISGGLSPLTRRRELDCLEQVSAEIARQTDPDVLVTETLKIMTQHLRAAGAKLLWNHGDAVFAEYVRGEMPELTDQVVQQALQTTEAVLVPVLDSNIRARSIFAPLKYLDHVEGVIWVAEKSDEAVFKHEDLCLVASIAHVLAPPLKMLLDMEQLQRKNESLLEATTVAVVGRSPEMQRVLQLVARVADVDQTVLLRGESGVGKEVVAQLIHETGARREQPYVCVNCAALTESLLESELFGHERGAFTGAVETRRGKFEMANNGTIFLDELGNMSLTTQAKLLRVLDGHAFERVGGHTPITVNVRVLAATNADLESLVESEQFREDLYHRLRVIEIVIPPLRQRPQDIVALAEYFLGRFIQQTGRRMAFEPDALKVLQQYGWPGNVRQLRNTIERAAILNEGSTISATTLELIVLGDRADQGLLPMKELTRAGIERAITESTNVPAAAKRLGMSRSALYRHMKKLDITPPRMRKQ